MRPSSALLRPIAVDAVGTAHERRDRRAPVERPSESARSRGANLGIIVEGQLGCVTRACDMRLSQPQPMLDVLDPQENVPTIGGVPDFAG
jgi:hypothetical protein